MDKYYVANLGPRLIESGPFRLIGVQYLRKPPTFGVLHLHTEQAQDGNNSHVGENILRADPIRSSTKLNDVNSNNNNNSSSRNQQILCLSCLELGDNNGAKFETVREIQLNSGIGDNYAHDHYVSFDLLSAEQTLIESTSSSSLSIEQRLNSTCFLLSQTGLLRACSLIDAVQTNILQAETNDIPTRTTNLNQKSFFQLNKNNESFVHLVIQPAPSTPAAEILLGSGNSSSSSNGRRQQQQQQQQLQHQRQQQQQQQSRYNHQTGADLLDYSYQFFAHILSDRCYYFYLIRVRQQRKESDKQIGSIYYDSQLLGTYSLLATTDNQPTNASAKRRDLTRARKFVKVLPLLETRPNVVLLVCHDKSIVILRDCKIIYPDATTSAASSSTKQRLISQLTLFNAANIILEAPDDNQIAILIDFDPDKRQLNAFSLLISDSDDAETGDELDSARQQSFEDHDDLLNMGVSASMGGINKATISTTRDPDKLLPEEPSFELEKCWSIDLVDEIGSLKTALDDDDDDDDIDIQAAPQDGQQNRRNCVVALCPLWSQEQNQLRNFSGGRRQSTRDWPKFMLLSYGSHLLLFSFEQQTTLPFSVVYDRAFLGFSNANSSSFESASGLQQQDQQQQQVGINATKSSKSADNNNSEFASDKTNKLGLHIDPKQKPNLVHNFKLVGSQPSDSLFNVIFLQQDQLGTINDLANKSATAGTHLADLKSFPQLGLMVAISGSGHILAFKLTSSQVTNQKNTLYQQQLVDLLSGSSSLLRHEIERLQRSNSVLKEDIANLDSQAGSIPTTSSTPTKLINSMISGSEQQTPHASSGAQVNQKFLTNLNQMISIELRSLNESDKRHSDAVVGLENELIIKWLNLIRIEQVVVVCNMKNCKILKPNQQQNQDYNQTTVIIETHVCPDNNWLVLELDNKRAENVSLSVPVLLLDELEQDNPGQLHVYFVFQTPTGASPYGRREDPAGSPYTASEERGQSLRGRRNWRLLANAGELAISKHHPSSALTSASLPMASVQKLFKKSLPIRLLNSYKLIDSKIGESISDHDNYYFLDENKTDIYNIEIEFKSGGGLANAKTNGQQYQDEHQNAMEWQTLAGWLAECLDHRNWSQLMSNEFEDKQQQQQQQLSNATLSKIRLVFESSLTRCRLLADLTLDRTRNNELVLRLKSDDFIALDCIKRHLLKRATDISISLGTSQDGQVSLEHLRHLLGLQVVNLVALHCEATFFKEADFYQGTRSKLNQQSSQTQMDLMLESLMGELGNKLNDRNKEWMFDFFGSSLDGDQSARLTTNWFEKSFRKDLEEINLDQHDLLDTKRVTNDDSKMMANRHSNQSNILTMEQQYRANLYAQHILTILVKFEEHNQAQSRPLTTKAMQSIREKLIDLISSSELLSREQSLVDSVLDLWRQTKTKTTSTPSAGALQLR